MLLPEVSQMKHTGSKPLQCKICTRLTVWKSTLKLYHAEKFSVKMHGKILLIPILQMDEFLYLGDILV